MKRQKSKPVLGLVAPAPRPTPLGAAIVAAAVALPIGAVILIAQTVLR